MKLCFPPRLACGFSLSLFLAAVHMTGAEVVTVELSGKFGQSVSVSPDFPPGAAYTLKITYDNAVPPDSTTADSANYLGAVTQVDLSVPSTGFSLKRAPDAPAVGNNVWNIDFAEIKSGRAAMLLRFQSPGSAIDLSVRWEDPARKALTSLALNQNFNLSAGYTHTIIDIAQGPSRNTMTMAAISVIWGPPSDPVSPAPVFRTGGYRELFVTGDSLSASESISWGSLANYFEKGYTNGPNWIQQLSWRLGIPWRKARNFAQFGTPKPFGAEVFADGSAPDTLAVYWSNSGLYTFLFFGEANMAADELTRKQAAVLRELSETGEHLTVLGKLHAYGVRNVLWLGSADISSAPDLGLFVSTAADKAEVAQIAGRTNQRILALLEELKVQYPGMAIRYLDPNPYLTAVRASPAAYGLTNLNDAALDTVTDKSLNGPGADFFYWDGTAPSTRVHSWLADFVYRDVFAGSPAEAAATYVRIFPREDNSIGLLFGGLQPAQTYKLIRTPDHAIPGTESPFLPKQPSVFFPITPAPGQKREFFQLRQ